MAARRLCMALVTALAIGSSPLAFAAETPAEVSSAKEVLHLSDRELARSGARMLKTEPTWSWQTNVRDKPGEVEIHNTRNDIVVVQEGSCEIFLGGVVTGARTTEPNELRGGGQANPSRQVLSAGDVMFIPAGMPHRMVPLGTRRFRYMVVKTQS